MTEQFIRDIKEGLEAVPKKISSKYFYDKRGDELFAKIMQLPEYYLTKSEHEIFASKTNDLIDLLNLKKNEYFELIELGSGNGIKTYELLKALLVDKFNFGYFPIDISQNSLNILKKNLGSKLPNLNIHSQQGDYFKVLSKFKNTPYKKIVLFLGSNIGNMSDSTAGEFIYNLGSNLSKKDRVLLGVDLIKPKDVVLPAYDDSKGITKEFNLNLLTRINNELEGNFNTNKFDHQPEYEETEGVAKSFLVSLENQTVAIKKINQSFSFSKGEKIHTEISRKYNDNVIQQIIKETDFVVAGKLLDSKKYFANYALERI